MVTMPVSIPLFDNANFTETVSLDGQNYDLAFCWNIRGEFWSMDISDGNGTLIQSGIRLVIWYPLKLQYTNPALPKGEFLLVDPSATTQNVEPGRHDFTTGRKLDLLYVSAV